MNRKALIVAGVAVLATIPIVVLTIGEEEPDEASFEAFSGELPELPPSAKQPAANRAAANQADRPTQAMRADGDGRDDTLNRTGPLDREVPEGRTVKNVRPNPGLPPGRQDRPIDPDEVRRGVEAVRPILRACYDGLLDDFPDASGKISVAFQLIDDGGKGRVDMGEIKADNSTIFEEKFHECVLEGIGAAEFEAPTTSPVSITYPFVFQRDEPEE